MSGEFSYLLAFTTGLLGAFHCLGMCGGLAAGYFAGHGAGHGWQRKLLPQLGYHGMRIALYVLLGTLGAALGRVLVQSGFVGKGQGLLMILAGIAVMIIGLGLTGLLPWWRRKPCPGGSCRTIRFEERPRLRHRLPLLAGTVNGLVPCSLVFSVALKAIATADPLQSGLLMLCFGLGTLPTMALVTTAGATAGALSRGAVEKLTGAVVVLLGAWTLYEGIVFYDIMRGLASW
jgi:sulfite exporter TauE/SafE